MTVSSRTPEGEPIRCRVCGYQLRVEPSRPPADAPCPVCGTLLWFGELPASQHVRPTKAFTITIHIEETGETKVFRVDPAAIPYGQIPLEGSVLDIACGAGVDTDHSCGGECACTTCHVKVIEGAGSCSKATEDEIDVLATGRNVGPDSRLGCQCVPDGSQDLVVVVPKWG